MAFNGYMEIDDKKYRMLKWGLNINQQTDQTGRPVANPAGGLITVVLESTGETDLFEWVSSPDMTKSGKITFQRRDNTSSLKTFEFKDAYCINYDEDFSDTGGQPMITSVTISAKELVCSAVKLKKSWNKASV